MMSSGSEVFDNLLNGGYSSNLLNLIYGPASSGKTTACMLASIACHNTGKKTIFVDTENGFSAERISQMTHDYKSVLDSIILCRPNSFDEQVVLFERLHEILDAPNIGLLIIDTIGTLYRAERTKDISKKNKQFISQIDIIRKLYKEYDFPIIATNQVYSSMEKDKVVPVGGQIISRRSKCMIELEQHDEFRRAILRKHPEIEERSVDFRIVNSGFRQI